MSSVIACGCISGTTLLAIIAFVFGPMCLSTLALFTWFGVKLRRQTPYSIRSLLVWTTVICLNFGWLAHWFA